MREMIKLDCSYFVQQDLIRFFWTYVIPVICAIGIITNLISALVFSNKALQRYDIYKYLQAHSTIQVMFLVLSLIYFLAYSILEGSFFLKLLDLFLQKYLTSVLALLMVCIEFLITIKRLLMIFNLNITIKISVRMTILVYFILCLIIHSPILLTMEIEQVYLPSNCSYLKINNSRSTQTIIYEISTKRLDNSKHFKFLFSIPFFIRGALLQIILLISNLIILIDYRKKRNILSNLS